MRSQQEVIRGHWWHHDGYEIRDGLVQPAPGSRLIDYGPWEAHVRARIGDAKSPLDHFLDLVYMLRADLDMEETEEALCCEPLEEWASALREGILAWCSRYGLLGMLPHRTLFVELAPSWDSEAAGVDSEGMRVFRTHQVGYRRFSTWVRSESSPFRVRAQRKPRGFEPGDPVSPRIKLPEAREPSAHIQRSPVEAPEEVPLAESWGPYFPSVSPRERSRYQYPMPDTFEFFELYSEPLRDWLGALHTIGMAASLFAEAAEDAQEEGADDDWVVAHAEAGQLFLDGAVLGASPIVELADDGLRTSWRAPSLYSYVALMLVDDLSGERRLRACENCGRLFTSSAYQATYCTPRCQNTAAKRRQRQRKRQKATKREARS
jgi:hypothetical protein